MSAQLEEPSKGIWAEIQVIKYTEIKMTDQVHPITFLASQKKFGHFRYNTSKKHDKVSINLAFLLLISCKNCILAVRLLLHDLNCNVATGKH